MLFAGITAASGISAELGIPLTQRGVANGVKFLTGHSRKGGTDPLFVAENAADPDSTLVVYMGLSTFPSLSLKLLHHGLPPYTPAVAVERGTTTQQRMVSMILFLNFSFFLFFSNSLPECKVITFIEALLFPFLFEVFFDMINCS